MLKSMDEISLASSNISKIIKVIDEIAFQTNILYKCRCWATRAGNTRDLPLWQKKSETLPVSAEWQKRQQFN